VKAHRHGAGTSPQAPLRQSGFVLVPLPVIKQLTEGLMRKTQAPQPAFYKQTSADRATADGGADTLRVPCYQSESAQTLCRHT